MPDHLAAPLAVTPPATTTQPTPTPAVAAGNADRVSLLGLAASGSGAALVDALHILEDEATWLLDHLPFPVAAQAAWAARSSPWAAAWVAALPARRLAAEAGAVWAHILDVLWPRGTALEVSLAAGGKVAVGLGAAGAVRVERDGAGFRLTSTMDGTLTAGEGLGFDVGGANGELLAGLGAGLEVAAGATVTLTWALDAGATSVLGDVGGLLAEPQGMGRSLVGLVRDTGLAPSAWRVEARGTGQAKAVAGSTPLQGRAALEAGGTAAVGMEGDRAFVEVAFGGALSGRLAGSLLDRLTAFGGLSAGLLEGSLAQGLVLRAEGGREAIAAGDLAEVDLVLTERSTELQTRTEDCLRTREFRVAAQWLKDRLIPGGLPFGGPDAREVPMDALPALTLVRQATRPLLDLDRIGLLAPSFLETFTEALPDHGVLVGLESAEVVGSVVVGPEAMRAAIGGVPIPVGDSPEEAVLAVERRIAAVAVGGALPPGDLGIPLDTAAGVAATTARDVAVVGRGRIRLGASGEAAFAAEAEVSGEGSITVERRVPLGEDGVRGLFLDGAG